MSKHIPNIVLTPGEPAGCGPDIVVQLVQKKLDASLTVIGDPDVFAERAKALQLPLDIHLVNDFKESQLVSASSVQIYPVKVEKKVIPGQLAIENAPYVLETLNLAVEACLAKMADALITGPVHKAVINAAGYPFSGHTHYLAEKTGTKDVVMFFMSELMQIALVTDHVQLTEVSKCITPSRLKKVIQLVHQYFPHESLYICGLNPHAGESGYLGREEIDIISPVIKKYRDNQLDITGPLSADSMFVAPLKKGIIIGMYHDQVLPVFKHLAFKQSANITLGLPFLRTSVDHGTALSLAGTTRVDAGSLSYVFQKTVAICHENSTA